MSPVFLGFLALLSQIMNAYPALALNSSGLTDSSDHSLISRSTLKNLEVLRNVARDEQIFLLKNHTQLEGQIIFPGYESVIDDGLNDEESYHVFEGVNPSFQWIDGPNHISCDAVRYIKKSSEYLFRRFKILRVDALVILEEMERIGDDELGDLSTRLDKVLIEIEEVLNLVKIAVPASFDNRDRIATYTLKNSSYALSKTIGNDKMLTGKLNVHKIKLGSNAWLPVKSGIKGIFNINEEPYTTKGQLYTFSRNISPVEACLSNLTIKMVAFADFITKLKTPVYVEPPRRTTPSYPLPPISFPMLPDIPKCPNWPLPSNLVQ